MAPLPPALVAYGAAITLASPLAPMLLNWRARKGKEDRERLGERTGRPGRDRPPGELVWAHGASIGETLSLLPLVEALVARGIKVLVTSGTRTSADLLARRLPAGARHQYVPLDVPHLVARFLDHWNPRLALFAESEIWPNLLIALDRRGIPRVLVNGRMSERSFSGWRRAPRIADALFGPFALCLAQSGQDGERLSSLGARHVDVVGNLKFDIAPLPADPATVETLSGRLAGRPVWMAASTHPGEDEHVVAVHLALAARSPKLLTLIAPRHPVRAADIADYATSAGLRTTRRSHGELPGQDESIHLVDTVGDLGLFYRLAPLVFMGGSLVPHGGQNPIEPTRLGAAVLHGPHIGNFQEAYGALDEAGGSLAVANPEALASTVGELLGQASRMRDMARRGRGAVDRLGGAVNRTLALIEPYLPPPAPRDEAIW